MFWDMKWKGLNDEEWKTDVVSPMPEFKKRIYDTEASAKEAADQMSKHYGEDHAYFILPIFTPEVEYAKVVEAYKERREKYKTQNSNG